VLDWSTAKVVIELHSLVGSSAHLILGSLLAQPEVDIPLKSLPSRASVGVQNDVRITSEEGTKSVLRLRNNLELLNAPDLEAHIAASSTPLLCNLLLSKFKLICHSDSFLCSSHTEY